jgi:hypothetical protein
VPSMPGPVLSSGGPLFAFFSNRLGCVGSIAVSVIGTVILVLLTWLLNR